MADLIDMEKLEIAVKEFEEKYNILERRLILSEIQKRLVSQDMKLKNQQITQDVLSGSKLGKIIGFLGD